MNKNFFWFTTKLENWENPLIDLLLDQEESEIWYGKTKRAYEEIKRDDIIVIYVPGYIRRLFGIAKCSKKKISGDGTPRVFIQGIKKIHGPEWNVLKNDTILKKSLPIRMQAMGTLFPLTIPEGLRLLELAKISLDEVGYEISNLEISMKANSDSRSDKSNGDKKILDLIKESSATEKVFYRKNDKLLELLLRNPYIHRVGDEIGRNTLARWVENQYTFKMKERIKQREILTLIGDLINKKIFISKKNYQTVITLSATSLYFELKKGKIIGVSALNENIDMKIPLGQKKDNIDEYTPNNEMSSFFEIFLDFIQSYKGENQEIIQKIPQFFNLLCNIMSHKDSRFEVKVLCSLALSYLIIEEDFTPDHEENGLIDDLFVIVYALKQIIDCDSPNLIKQNWPYEEDIIQLIQTIYLKTYEILEDEIFEILKIVGLDKFSLYNSTLLTASCNEVIAK